MANPTFLTSPIGYKFLIYPRDRKAARQRENGTVGRQLATPSDKAKWMNQWEA